MPSLNASQRASYRSSGDRSKRVTLSSATTVTDGLGGRTETWSDYGKAWGSVTAQADIKSESESTVLYVIEIPYRSDVTKGHRASVGGKTLKVLEVVNPEMRNKAVQLHCGETL